MKKLVLMIGFILILAACSNQTTVEKTKEDKKVEAKQKQDKQKERKDTYRKELIAYSEEITSPTNEISKNLNELAKVIKSGTDEPSIIQTTDYRETIELICGDIDKNIEEIKELDIPQNDHIEELHNILINGLDNLKYVAIHYPDAVIFFNLNELEKCREYTGEGVQQMKLALSKLAVEMAGAL